jgi:WD40 repeat protein
VTALAFAPDGGNLYTGDSAGWVLAWDVATHECRKLFRRAEPSTGNRGVYDLWPTPDGARLFVSDDRKLFDALRPDAGPLLVAPKDSWGWWRYLLSDGRVISCEPEWRVGLWDLRTGERLPVPGALGAAKHITYHHLLPDGVTLLTYHSGSGNELPLWDFRTGERIGELAPGASGINPCAPSADGKSFAVGRKSKLWVYDVPSRSLRHQLKFEKDLRELAFHPNGRLLASASTNSVVTLWDATAGERVTQFDWQSGKVRAVCFAPDGLTCAVGGVESFVVFDVDL